MAFKRTELEVEEVSFVDKPAVQKAKVFMTKNLGEGKVSFLKMKGGEDLNNNGKTIMEKFQGFMAKTKERLEKAVGSIAGRIGENKAEEAFWDRYWDVKWAFDDLVYEIMDDTTVIDKAGALYGLIDEHAAEMKTTVNLLLTMQKGADMDEKRILDAIAGIGTEVTGLGKRLEVIEAKGGGQPEVIEKTEGAEAGAAGAETSEGKILALVEGLGKQVTEIGKRLAVVEGQPLPSSQIPGQEVKTTKAAKRGFFGA